MITKRLNCDSLSSAYQSFYHARVQHTEREVRTYLLVCMSTVPEVMIWRRRRAQSVVHWVLLCTVSNIPPTWHEKNATKHYYKENTNPITLCSQFWLKKKKHNNNNNKTLVYGLSYLLSYLPTYLSLFLGSFSTGIWSFQKKKERGWEEKGKLSVGTTSVWIK